MSSVSNFNRLWCNAEVKFKTKSGLYCEFYIDNGPCFGMYTHSSIISNPEDLIYDVDIVVYQNTGRSLSQVIKDRLNNFCSLTKDQLEKFHRELEVVFENATTELKSGIHISFDQLKADFIFSEDYYNKKSVYTVYKIKAHLDCITHFGLKALLTFIRLSSEYPTALLLRESFNMRSSGLFPELSNLQVFQAILPRLNYYYDQGITPVGLDSSRNFIKPLNLKRLGAKVTKGTPEFISTNNRVLNILEVVDRTDSNRTKFKIPRFYSYGATSEYEEPLYKEVNVEDIIIRGKVSHLEDYKKLVNAVKSQFSKLIVDYPNLSSKSWIYKLLSILKKNLDI